MRHLPALTMASLLAIGCAGSNAAEPAAPPAMDHEDMDHGEMDHSQHAGHEHGDSAAGALRTPVPALTEADRRAALPPAMAHVHGDDAIHSYSLFNRLESWDADPGTGLAWEAEGWIGGDIHRLWWNTDGERVAGHTEAAQVELLYGRSFAPRWDWVAGARQDIRPRESRSYLAFGLQGLAPQWFEVSVMGYVGEGGRTALRLASEYNLLFTNRLMLQPVAEAALYGKEDAARGIGAGLTTVELGMRLRYEFTRQFAPYLGVTWERAFGDTADLRRDAGEDVTDARLVAGIRIWF